MIEKVIVSILFKNIKRINQLDPSSELVNELILRNT